MPVRKERHVRKIPKWSPKMENEHILTTWAGNRRLVQWATYPPLFCIGVAYAWHFLKAPGYPPRIMTVVILGGVALSLITAFVYWRCPSCSEILFRTSKSGAGVLFWLSDPADCPYCGVKLSKFDALE